MTSYPLQWPAITANDRFKAQYPKYLRWAVLLALIMTILVFLFSPPYVAHPYQKRIREEFEWVVFEPPLVEPRKPLQIPAPPRPIEPALDDEVLNDADIPITLYSPGDADLYPPRWTDDDPEIIFVPSSTPPELIHQPAPEYPEMARLTRLEGLVIVNVLVGPDGRIVAAKIEVGAHRILNRAALEAARKCTFEPGFQRSRPVPVWVQIPYRFCLH